MGRCATLVQDRKKNALNTGPFLPSAPFKQVSGLTFRDKTKVAREAARVNKIKQLIDGDGMRPLVTFNGRKSEKNERKGHARAGAQCCCCHLKVPYYPNLC